MSSASNRSRRGIACSAFRGRDRGRKKAVSVQTEFNRHLVKESVKNEHSKNKNCHQYVGGFYSSQVVISTPIPNFTIHLVSKSAMLILFVNSEKDLLSLRGGV